MNLGDVDRMGPFTIGCDIGGTFTDTVVVDRATGVLRQFKAPTTPGEVRVGIMSTLDMAAEAIGTTVEDLLASVDLFSHGTTVATNALVERRGARTGLIQTMGFGDTLAIMRGGRLAGRSPDELRRFSRLVKPAPLIPDSLVVEVPERIDYQGRVVAPLDAVAANDAVRALLELGVESVAICLLWSFRNDIHERILRDIFAREAPNVFVTLSSELVPRIKEYERTATTAINSYVGPVLQRSLASLEEALFDRGLRHPALLMQSSGGLASVSESIKQAARTLLSGPAGGVTGSARLGRALGYPNVVTTDMGGTTFDVGLIVDYEPLMVTEGVVDGYMTCLPSIGISAIGAGGGSIAKVRHEYLEVGPESAGATPGPVCYGQGGTQPTVTDADVALGIIDPAMFLGGRLPLDKAAAIEAIRGQIAEPLGMSVHEAAAAIRTITDNKIADLIRRVTVERGYDVRDFVIFAFGGGGPTHACSYGSEVQAQAIVVPHTASVHSAAGIASADLQTTVELSRSIVAPAGGEPLSAYVSPEQLNDVFAQLEEQAAASLGRQSVPAERVEMTRRLEMRFRGQIYEVTIPVQSGPLSTTDVDALRDRFVARYETLYGEGSSLPGQGIEIITFRVEGRAPTPKPAVPAATKRGRRRLAPFSRREVYLLDDCALHELPVFSGDDLRVGDQIDGAAIIELAATTVMVNRGHQVAVDPMLNLVITLQEKRT
jgi:N-methylhydantoinase A